MVTREEMNNAAVGAVVRSNTGNSYEKVTNGRWRNRVTGSLYYAENFDRHSLTSYSWQAPPVNEELVAFKRRVVETARRYQRDNGIDARIIDKALTELDCLTINVGDTIYDMTAVAALPVGSILGNPENPTVPCYVRQNSSTNPARTNSLSTEYGGGRYNSGGMVLLWTPS